MRITFFLSVIMAGAMISDAAAQCPFDVFPTRTEADVPYRIPAIAALPDGTVVCVADYRHSRSDIGMKVDGRIDLHVRISRDNGCSWGEIASLMDGKGAQSSDFMNVAFGDPCIVADRDSGQILVMSCAGNVSFPKGRRDCHQCIARFYSDDGGLSWSHPEDIAEQIYEQFDKASYGPVKSMFIASGKIMQSTISGILSLLTAKVIYDFPLDEVMMFIIVVIAALSLLLTIVIKKFCVAFSRKSVYNNQKSSRELLLCSFGKR